MLYLKLNIKNDEILLISSRATLATHTQTNRHFPEIVKSCFKVENFHEMLVPIYVVGSKNIKLFNVK